MEWEKIPKRRFSPGDARGRLGRSRLPVILLMVLALVVPVLLQGCGGGYEALTVDTRFVPSDITPQQLNSWIQNGFVDDQGFPVVILDTSSSDTYQSGHIPGAFLVTEGHSQTRSDGVLQTPTMVLSGPAMNALVQRLGIQSRHTTIVITGSSLFTISRFYYDFRYWGFPQSRLKVLRGTNQVWTDAGLALSMVIPSAPTPSSFSVADNVQATEIRASLAEMISVAEGMVPDTLVWDVRRANEYNGDPGATNGPTSSGKVAFEGHIKGAVNLNVLNTDPAAGPIFLESFQKVADNATILASLATIGVTKDVTTYVY